MTIDVQRYIDALEALKTWTWLRILDRECDRRQLEIFFETGVLLTRIDRIPDFDTWYQQNGWKYENGFPYPETLY